MQGVAVSLRLKLLSGSTGAQLNASGIVTSITGQAMLEMGDCVIDHTTALLPTSKCEVTLLRQDSGLANAAVEHGFGSDSTIPCFRMIRIPLRSMVEGYEIIVDGLRVQQLQGQPLADGLLQVDDLIVAVNGSRVDKNTLLTSLRKQTSALQVFTILRRASEHDMDARKASIQWAKASQDGEQSAIASHQSAIASPSVVESKVASSSVAVEPVAGSDSTEQGGSSNVSQERVSNVAPANCDTSASAPPSIAAVPAAVSTPPAPAPASKAPPAPTAIADFEPLDDVGGVWSDLPSCKSSTKPRAACSTGPGTAFDNGSGMWSDVPKGDAHPNVDDARIALLDVMIRQALASKDDMLLRRLVSAQQALRRGAPQAKSKATFVTL
jgi:hypothetical protein